MPRIPINMRPNDRRLLAAVFNVVTSFLGNSADRFVAEVESIEV